MKFSPSIWWLLLAGVAVRCLALNQPLLDAHSARQCQTAAATASMIAEPGFPLSAEIPWAGDLEARYVQELPIYNYLTIALHWLIGNLDASGKLVTVSLWAASFLCLQLIWRRILKPAQAFWANLLFVVAPLSVFYGQAFMPEMLVQILAFAFVLLVILYHENPTLGRWIALAAIGALGSLVKLPEFSHLYFILGFVVLRRESWHALLRPRYIIAAVLTLAALKGWSLYVDQVNGLYLPEWTSSNNLRVFVGSWQDRLQIRRWAMVFLYLGAFILSGTAIPAAAYGLWILVRRKPSSILGLWLFSLGLFYLFWFGNGPGNQSYYNLPALAPLCALFGLGMGALVAREDTQPRRRSLVVAAIALTLLPALPLWGYLFRQDRQISAAASWIKHNTEPGDLILFRPNHHWAAVDYPYSAAIAHYGERPTFVWTAHTAPRVRDEAISRARYAVVTTSERREAPFVDKINRIRNVQFHPERMDWLESAGFISVAEQSGFAVYRR